MERSVRSLRRMGGSRHRGAAVEEAGTVEQLGPRQWEPLERELKRGPLVHGWNRPSGGLQVTPHYQGLRKALSRWRGVIV